MNFLFSQWGYTKVGLVHSTGKNGDWRVLLETWHLSACTRVFGNLLVVAACYLFLSINVLHFLIKLAVVCQAPTNVHTSVFAWDIVRKSEYLYLAMW